MAKVFVSYNWTQRDWVWDRLVPVLEAAGIEVLIDKDRFKAGRGLIGQMDALQDEADRQVLCLSADYLKSTNCRHEMKRALASDPLFSRDIIIPIRLDSEPLPAVIRKPNPLYIDFQDDSDPAKWHRLLTDCGGSLGIAAPAWLKARDLAVHHLQRGELVYMLIKGSNARWRGLVDHLCAEKLPRLTCVDLDTGMAATRDGLLSSVLQALGLQHDVRPAPHDLGDFQRAVEALSQPALVALTHFENVKDLDYGIHFFRVLRNLVNRTAPKMALLVSARAPLEILLPARHPMSEIDFHLVELA